MTGALWIVGERERRRLPGSPSPKAVARACLSFDHSRGKQLSSASL